MRTIILALAAATLAVPVRAQHDDHAQHSSPYAGQEPSGIAALSAGEVEQLRTGAGMGMARAAEVSARSGALLAHGPRARPLLRGSSAGPRPSEPGTSGRWAAIRATPRRRP